MAKQLTKKTTKGAPQAQRRSPVSFMKEVNAELKKVTWPKREELVSSTLVVIIAVVTIAAYVGVVDALFVKMLSVFAL